MSSRRTLILIVAIALGAVAAFALFNYVNGLEDDIRADVEPVDVFKAAEPVPRDTPGELAADEGLIVSSQIAQEFRPQDAITTLSQINGKVAVFDIPAGIPITQSMFVDPADAAAGFRRRLTNPEWVTVTVSVDQVTGVANLLAPGDEVNIMYLVDLTEQEGAEDQLFDQRYEMLYEEVPILAVGQTAEALPGETTEAEGEEAAAESTVQSGLITFAVPVPAARLIASATQSGSIYLSLVPEDYVPEPLDPLGQVDTLPGQDPQKLTPCGPEGCEAG